MIRKSPRILSPRIAARVPSILSRTAQARHPQKAADARTAMLRHTKTTSSATGQKETTTIPTDRNNKDNAGRQNNPDNNKDNAPDNNKDSGDSQNNNPYKVKSRSKTRPTATDTRNAPQNIRRADSHPMVSGHPMVSSLGINRLLAKSEHRKRKPAASAAAISLPTSSAVNKHKTPVQARRPMAAKAQTPVPRAKVLAAS